MAFFIPFDIFLEVVKLHLFRKKILGTLADALSEVVEHVTTYYVSVDSTIMCLLNILLV
jgi:hypothetical protein